MLSIRRAAAPRVRLISSARAARTDPASLSPTVPPPAEVEPNTSNNHPAEEATHAASTTSPVQDTVERVGQRIAELQETKRRAELLRNARAATQAAFAGGVVPAASFRVAAEGRRPQNQQKCLELQLLQQADVRQCSPPLSWMSPPDLSGNSDGYALNSHSWAVDSERKIFSNDSMESRKKDIEELLDDLSIRVALWNYKIIERESLVLSNLSDGIDNTEWNIEFAATILECNRKVNEIARMRKECIQYLCDHGQRGGEIFEAFDALGQHLVNSCAAIARCKIFWATRLLGIWKERNCIICINLKSRLLSMLEEKVDKILDFNYLMFKYEVERSWRCEIEESRAVEWKSLMSKVHVSLMSIEYHSIYVDSLCDNGFFLADKRSLERDHDALYDQRQVLLSQEKEAHDLLESVLDEYKAIVSQKKIDIEQAMHSSREASQLTNKFMTWVGDKCKKYDAVYYFCTQPCFAVGATMVCVGGIPSLFMLLNKLQLSRTERMMSTCAVYGALYGVLTAAGLLAPSVAGIGHALGDLMWGLYSSWTVTEVGDDPIEESLSLGITDNEVALPRIASDTNIARVRTNQTADESELDTTASAARSHSMCVYKDEDVSEGASDARHPVYPPRKPNKFFTAKELYNLKQDGVFLVRRHMIDSVALAYDFSELMREINTPENEMLDVLKASSSLKTRYWLQLTVGQYRTGLHFKEDRNQSKFKKKRNFVVLANFDRKGQVSRKGDYPMVMIAFHGMIRSSNDEIHQASFNKWLYPDDISAMKFMTVTFEHKRLLQRSGVGHFARIPKFYRDDFKCHMGFFDAADSACDVLLPIIDNMLKRSAVKFTDAQFVVTGHSMGGAIASIISVALIHKLSSESRQKFEVANHRKNNIVVLTMGAPRVWGINNLTVKDIKEAFVRFTSPISLVATEWWFVKKLLNISSIINNSRNVERLFTSGGRKDNIVRVVTAWHFKIDMSGLKWLSFIGQCAIKIFANQRVDYISQVPTFFLFEYKGAGYKHKVYLPTELKNATFPHDLKKYYEQCMMQDTDGITH